MTEFLTVTEQGDGRLCVNLRHVTQLAECEGGAVIYFVDGRPPLTTRTDFEALVLQIALEPAPALDVPREQLAFTDVVPPRTPARHPWRSMGQLRSAATRVTS